MTNGWSIAYTTGSSDECSLCLLGGHTSLTNTSDEHWMIRCHLALDHLVTFSLDSATWSPSSEHTPDHPTSTFFHRRIIKGIAMRHSYLMHAAFFLCREHNAKICYSWND